MKHYKTIAAVAMIPVLALAGCSALMVLPDVAMTGLQVAPLIGRAVHGRSRPKTALQGHLCRIPSALHEKCCGCGELRPVETRNSEGSDLSGMLRVDA